MNIIITAIFLVLSGVLGWIVRWVYARYHLTSNERRAKRVLTDAEKEAEIVKKDLVYESREILQKEKRDHDREIRERQRELTQTETRLQRKDDQLASKSTEVESARETLKSQEGRTEKERNRLAEKEKDLISKLESIARLTREEAHKQIMEQVKAQARHDIQNVVYKIEQDAMQSAEKRAKELLVMSAQRLASEVSAEITVSSVDLPNEDMKGRVIGREGRNIRVLEMLTGADIVIDDTPGVVVISCFNPVRRAVATQTLSRLIKDGRIHPARIEEEVEKVTKNINQVVYDEGEKTFLELGLQGNMHTEGLRTIGRLKFRTSYGQNLLGHSKEVAFLAGIIAKEIGADSDIAKRGGLLHDIGKAIDFNGDFTHVELGVELAKRINESPEVINCIAAHHSDVPHSCLESVIVQIADSMSAARPGARRDTLEHYIERLGKLEAVATEIDGVESAYAVHAGRELRVIVESKGVSDIEVQEIAHTICTRIEDTLKYPGRVKVTVIKETKIVEYAR